MSEANVQDNADQPLEDQGSEEGVETTGASPAEDADAAMAELGTEDLRAELDEANSRVLRAQAELENFRKRARRDMDEQRQYANLPLMADLLPAVDNLDRAIEAAEKNENATGLLEGVRMVSEHILSILGQHHCVPIEAEGRPFDPNVHEAIAQEPRDDVSAGDVTRVLRIGYQLHGRVIRPAQVMVSTGPAQSTDENAIGDASDESSAE